MKPIFAILVLAIIVAAGVYFYKGSDSQAGPSGGNDGDKEPRPNSTASVVPAPAKATPDSNSGSETAVPKFGALKGVCKYDGDPPEMKKYQVDAANQPGCKCKEVENESLVVDKATKGIKWVIVRVMDVKPKDPPAKPAKTPELDQKGCTFTPHVIVVPPAITDLNTLNPDKIMHNVHTSPTDFLNPEQNYAQGPGEEVKPYKAKWMEQPEIIEIKCNVHPWMRGYIVVHDPRFCAVTGADGTFEIKDIPPGKYQVAVWQEECGYTTDKKEMHPVEIKAGKTFDMGELKFKKK